MTQLLLTRYESYEDGTFGILKFNGFELHTVEKSWLNNEPFKSCIPPGEYTLTPFTRSNGDHVLALSGGTVSIEQDPRFKRYAVLIHPANYATEVVGCVAPGLHREGNMVTHSRDAMMEIMNHISSTNTIVIQFGEV